MRAVGHTQPCVKKVGPHKQTRVCLERQERREGRRSEERGRKEGRRREEEREEGRRREEEREEGRKEGRREQRKRKEGGKQLETDLSVSSTLHGRAVCGRHVCVRVKEGGCVGKC